ncbi:MULTISPECIES: HAD family hydrolase [unclassified Bradyrhizobium]|uniref:HAD family hydrolase n=1 Tax=unclassified Bradyrhizobium TaxID=2631580 RepID=UPI0024784CC1|nr:MULTISPECIES: HAD family hydrolase [unclassified Bradyrhizobium]WGR69612.1 haloacid dehalogenase-like hydrolase [Bradyrhizobium sp. ISRA426]WGR81669.1 haloacid dehalogenase-like hydrolase [Bradyrhizobium sp. ISRA430]WGR84853.1 haloacid dehalogenase-like hydrolase [Bradyrhizobium sp. ISRA432]
MKGTWVDRRAIVAGLLVSTATLSLSNHVAVAQDDPLPSWSEGQPKRSIVDFVSAVTREGSPDFVPAPERIATFDNDGTLWCEQPMYVQLAFALDRVKALAGKHPEWRKKQPFKAVLDNDIAALAKSGEKGLVELVMATHAGMTTAEFEKIASDWIATARHPKFGRLYTELVYQPMLELLAYLRANGFKTFIVSGGGIEFMRPWSEKVYGIPPEQVVGSSIKTKFEIDGGHPALMRLPAIDLVDDGPGKPVGINSHIGRRPIAAFGNSDGDFQMLQWTTGQGGRRFGLIVHHTDAEREYSYDRKSSFGRLDKALDAAAANKWTVVSMKDDWKRIFSFQ